MQNRYVGFIEFDCTRNGEERIILYNILKLGFQLRPIIIKDENVKPEHAQLRFCIIKEEKSEIK